MKRRRAVISVRTACPSRKPTTRVWRRISRFSRLNGLLVRVRRRALPAIHNTRAFHRSRAPLSWLLFPVPYRAAFKSPWSWQRYGRTPPRLLCGPKPVTGYAPDEKRWFWASGTPHQSHQAHKTRTRFIPLHGKGGQSHTALNAGHGFFSWT